MLLPVFVLLFQGAGGWNAPSNAQSCGRCHRTIYEHWKASKHADAYQNPLFQSVLERAEADFGAEGRAVCLTCHAPVTANAWDGVFCDYCHSIHEVSFTGRNPSAEVSFSESKAGPVSDAAAAPHGSRYSDLHATAAICAPCHEYRNAGGFPVMSTYSEWQNSSYGKAGKPCQTCHMARTEGDVVDPRVARAGKARLNLHEMRGGHTADQLAAAIQMRMTAARVRDEIQVTVEITNAGAGHSFPTGSPLRQMELEVTAGSAEGRLLREQRRYAREVADHHGTVLMREHFAFLRAAETVSDTRLKPGEKRLETFVFRIPAGDPAKIDATLWYVYSPLARTETETKLAFASLRRTLK